MEIQPCGREQVQWHVSDQIDLRRANNGLCVAEADRKDRAPLIFLVEKKCYFHFSSS